MRVFLVIVAAMSLMFTCFHSGTGLAADTAADSQLELLETRLSALQWEARFHAAAIQVLDGQIATVSAQIEDLKKKGAVEPKDAREPKEMKK